MPNKHQQSSSSSAAAVNIDHENNMANGHHAQNHHRHHKTHGNHGVPEPTPVDSKPVPVESKHNPATGPQPAQIIIQAPVSPQNAFKGLRGPTMCH